jgi:hypothetical protein
MINWILLSSTDRELLPEIPDYALDKHTAAGQAIGRGDRHFWEIGARLNPELSNRDLTYLDRVMEILDESETTH